MHISVHTHSHTLTHGTGVFGVQFSAAVHWFDLFAPPTLRLVLVQCHCGRCQLQRRWRFGGGLSWVPLTLFSKRKTTINIQPYGPPIAIDRLKVLLLCFAGAPRCPACVPWTSGVLLSHSQPPASYRLEQIVHRWHWAEMTSAMKIFHYKPCVSLSHAHTWRQQPRVDIKQAYFGYQSRLMGWKNIWVLLYSSLLPHAQTGRQGGFEFSHRYSFEPPPTSHSPPPSSHLFQFQTVVTQLMRTIWWCVESCTIRMQFCTTPLILPPAFLVRSNTAAVLCWLNQSN